MTISQSLPHDSGHLHVTGRAHYVDDIPVPRDCLHLAFGLSELAAGQIKDIDLAPVQNAEGVVAVITATDLPFANDVSPSAHDEPLLSDGRVHYIGQPLFLVVATSHHLARRAARLAKVEYISHPPILTIDEALEKNSRFEDGPRIYSRGDVTYALPKCAHHVSGRFEIGGQEHFYLESQAALAVPQEDQGMVHI